MATNQFDELTKAFAGSTSRRQALKALVLGAGGLLGLGSLGTALAGEVHSNLQNCKGPGASCTAGYHECCPGLKCIRKKCGY